MKTCMYVLTLNKSNNGSLQEQKKSQLILIFCFSFVIFFPFLSKVVVLFCFFCCGGFCIQERFVIQAETKIGTKFAKLELSLQN